MYCVATHNYASVGHAHAHAHTHTHVHVQGLCGHGSFVALLLLQPARSIELAWH